MFGELLSLREVCLTLVRLALRTAAELAKQQGLCAAGQHQLRVQYCCFDNPNNFLGKLNVCAYIRSLQAYPTLLAPFCRLICAL